MSAQEQHKEVALPSARLTMLTKDADHRVALFGAVLINVWIRETRVEALQAMQQQLEAAARGIPDRRLALFVVVEPNAIMPSAEARAALANMRRSPAIGVTVLVHEGTGFTAALVRGITTSLNLIERVESRTHVFADVASAAKWLEDRAPQHGKADAISAAVQSLRA
ncbi:MAG TPA: hypothetical protein VGL13_00665 [Polyangiaceae bacterium]